MRNSAFMHRFNELDGLELLIADLLDHRFDVHWHDTWSIGVVLRGAKNYSVKGKADGIVCRGQISIISPGELHAGTALGVEGCHYFMFYPSHEMLLDAAESMAIHLPAIDGKRTEHQCLAIKLYKTATVLTDMTSSHFDREVAWSEIVAELLHAFSSCQSLTETYDISPSLRKAKEYLHDHSAQEVRLDELAQVVGVSKFHLSRQFSAKVGLSPSRYQRQLRVQQARVLLSRGGDIAEIAITCGFADQSHLGRHFKSTYGVTPCSYRDGGI